MAGAVLTLGQKEAIAAEVWGPSDEIAVRSERLVYVQLVLAGWRVEGLSDDEIDRIRTAALPFVALTTDPRESDRA